MISTRGRYALRVMIDIAEHSGGDFVPMKEVAARQEISLKYIERIMPLLTKENLVEGQHGKGGGYRLCRRRITPWAKSSAPRKAGLRRWRVLNAEQSRARTRRNAAHCQCGRNIMP